MCLVCLPSYHCTFILTLNQAKEIIVPPAGLPNQGLIKKHNANIGINKKNFLRGVLPVTCQEQLKISISCRIQIECVVYLFIYTFHLSPRVVINSEAFPQICPSQSQSAQPPFQCLEVSGNCCCVQSGFWQRAEQLLTNWPLIGAVPISISDHLCDWRSAHYR